MCPSKILHTSLATDGLGKRTTKGYGKSHRFSANLHFNNGMWGASTVTILSGKSNKHVNVVYISPVPKPMVPTLHAPSKIIVPQKVFAVLDLIAENRQYSEATDLLGFIGFKEKIIGLCQALEIAKGNQLVKESDTIKCIDACLNKFYSTDLFGNKFFRYSDSKMLLTRDDLALVNNAIRAVLTEIQANYV